MSTGGDEACPQDRATPILDACASTLAGYLFSVILSIAIAALILIRFSPAQAVERAGIDIGMRFFATFQTFIDPAFQRPEHRYVFIDLDDKSCGGARGRALALCPKDEPASPLLARQWISIAARGGAAVVIVDLAPPRRPADRSELVKVASGAGDNTLVIAPLVADFKGDQANLFEADDPLIPAPFRQGSLRLAPFVTQPDPFAGDGVIRHYPATIGVGERDLPTAPYLASGWVAGGQAGRTVVCDAFGGTARDCASPRQRGARPLVAKPVPGELSPLFWTIPPQWSREQADRLALYEPLVDYVRASDVLGDDGLVDEDRIALREAFAGRIVVIGSSAPRARDLHRTPLGINAGSEIVLNATRSFLEFGNLRLRGAPMGPGEILEAVIEKAGGAIVPALFLFAPWWVIHRARAPREGRSLFVRSAVWTGAAVFFVAMMALGLAFELSMEAAKIKGNALAGRPVDLVTPVLALGLDAFASVAKAVSSKLEATTHEGLTFVRKEGLRLGGLARSRLGKGGQ